MQTFTPIKTGAFLTQGKRLQELTKIRSASITLLKLKKDRLKLEKKFQETKDKFTTRQQILNREKAQESKKRKSLKGKLARKGERVLSGGLLDFITTLAKLQALLWLSDPKNIKLIQGIFDFFKGVFKVIDFFATMGVEGLLGGLNDLVAPDSTIMQRLFGVFKIFGGFFILSKLLRWSNPLNAIKDIYKNKAVISKIFRTLASRDFKGALDGIKRLLTPQIFRKGLGQAIQRTILKVFGKGGLKAVQSLAVRLGFKTATQMVKQSISKGASVIAKRIPFVGPFIGLGINLFMGTPLDVSAVRFAGAVAGEWIGRVLFGLLGVFLGSIIPGAGTALGGATGLAVGGFIGNLVGEWIGDAAYGWLKSVFGGKKKEEPALAVGGIVTKPTRALIGEAGPEAVIPLGHIYNGGVLSAPFGIIASSMIGGIDALITSMGPVGLTIRPFAQQLLSPYTREFGKTNYAFTSDLARQSGTPAGILAASVSEETDGELSKIVGSGLALNIIQRKEQEKQERYNSGSSIREILADILNNIINLDTTKPGGGGGGGGDEDPAKPKFTGPIPQGKSADFWTLAAVASREDGDPQGQADVAQSIYNRLASGAYSGKTIKDLIISTWQYEPTWRYPKGPTRGNGTPNEEWLNITDIKSAAAATGTSEGHVAAAARAILDAGLQKKAAEFVQGRTDFTGYPKTSRKSQVQRKSGDNYFGWDFNYRNNLVASVPSFTGVKMQLGGVVPTQGVSDTGPGYTIQGATDQRGRPVVFSQDAASAFHRMMKDSGGVVKASDVASSKRSPAKNRDVGGATRSKHMYGIAMDIHGSSEKWIRKYGAKYGWVANDYPGSHGGHFEFGGKGIQPSDSPQTTQETTSTEESTPTWMDIAPKLKQLAELLNPSAPRVDSESLSSMSMDFVQAAKLPVKLSDTYIIPQGNTMVSNVNMITPIQATDYSIGSFSQLDSSSYLAQRRL